MVARRFGGKSAATGGKGTVRRKHKAVSYFAPVTERDTRGENWFFSRFQRKKLVLFEIPAPDSVH